MKHKLLSMAALGAAMLTSASAFGFEEPIAPEKPTTAGEFVSGHRYFIRNVGAGQYLTGGNAWSTQISLTRDGMTDEQNPAILFFIEDSTTTISDVEVSGYTLKLNGSFVFNGDGGTRTITNTFLFRDLGDGSGVSGFVDRASQNGWIWNITKRATTIASRPLLLTPPIRRLLLNTLAGSAPTAKSVTTSTAHRWVPPSSPSTSPKDRKTPTSTGNSSPPTTT